MNYLCYWGLLLLVGGFEHVLFSISYMGLSFPLTFIFFKMDKTTSQIVILDMIMKMIEDD